jgi:hypothetical protein
VAAAGNDLGHAVGTPANCVGVIGVAGLRHVATRSAFSSLGPEVSLSAPAATASMWDPAPRAGTRYLRRRTPVSPCLSRRRPAARSTPTASMHRWARASRRRWWRAPRR